jgi:hypothetical protein
MMSKIVIVIFIRLAKLVQCNATESILLKVFWTAEVLACAVVYFVNLNCHRNLT